MKKQHQEELVQMEGNWKRALADYQNLLKRIESEKKDFIKFAMSNIMTKLIPSLDMLDLAVAHSDDPGIRMAVKQFRDTLISEGLQEIMPVVGDIYDHKSHECLESVPGDPDNTISEVVQRGYKLDGFVIRPARVKVFKSS